MPEQLFTRATPDRGDLVTRAASLGARGGSESFDEDTRSIEIVAATEARVQVFDWARGRVIDEVLLMSGLQPVPRQVPFIDAHYRGQTATAMLGSARELRVEGDQLIGRVFFGTSVPAEDVMGLARDGHLTDVSVGYAVDAHEWIEDGKSAEVEGKTYTGPIRVATKWRLREVSAVPIGADEAAKVRAAQPQREKEKPMDERLRAYLESRGLAEDASEQAAWEYLAKLQREEVNRATPPAPNDPGDGGNQPPAGNRDAGDQGQRNASPADPGATAEAERARAAEIYALCRAHEVDDDKALEFITGGGSVDQCARQVLGLVAERQGGGPGYHPPARVVHDERDKYRAAAQDALLVRGGKTLEAPAVGYDELRGFSLKELARDCLRRAGQPTGGTDYEMIGRAYTSSDLPNILANVANKSVLFGWETAAPTWQLWADDSGSVPDFKESTLVRLSEFDDLDELQEDGEYNYAEISDIKESFKIGSYGKAIRFGRMLIINDDLSMLTSIPQGMGEAAARTVADTAYAALLSNPAMGDGKALFHTDHNNKINIAALDVTGIGSAVQTLGSQLDAEGKRRLNIMPVFFLSPVAQFVTAEKFFGSDFIGTAAEPNIKNPFGGTFTRERRIYEGRLDDAGASVLYILGPKGKTIRVYFLNGNKTPFIDFTDDWNTDGRKGKVRIDVGAKALDWRGMVQATITG